MICRCACGGADCVLGINAGGRAPIAHSAPSHNARVDVALVTGLTWSDSGALRAIRRQAPEYAPPRRRRRSAAPAADEPERTRRGLVSQISGAGVADACHSD